MWFSSFHDNILDDVDYLKNNNAFWNAITDLHQKSEFYAVDWFIASLSSLNTIEVDLLGDVRDKRILHLQCHFGMDTISLSKRGEVVTGVDLSDASITKANERLAIPIVDTVYNLSVTEA